MPATLETTEAAIEERWDLVTALEKPVRREWLSARIGTLLAHYWTPENDDTLSRVIAADWIGVLCHLPQWTIEQACVDYLASEDSRRKPQPGQIRALAVKALERVGPVREDIKQLEMWRDRYAAPAPPSKESRERMTARVAEFKRHVAEKELEEGKADDPGFGRVQRDRASRLAAAASRVLGYAVETDYPDPYGLDD